MLRKVTLVLSVISALGLGFAMMAPSASFAKDPPNQNQNKPKQNKPKQNKPPQQKNIVVKPKNVVVKKKVTVKYVIGHKYNGHIWYGYNRHRWHGIWYAYGVGPCWILIDDVFFWNILACPE